MEKQNHCNLPLGCGFFVRGVEPFEKWVTVTNEHVGTERLHVKNRPGARFSFSYVGMTERLNVKANSSSLLSALLLASIIVIKHVYCECCWCVCVVWCERGWAEWVCHAAYCIMRCIKWRASTILGSQFGISKAKRIYERTRLEVKCQNFGSQKKKLPYGGWRPAVRLYSFRL